MCVKMSVINSFAFAGAVHLNWRNPTTKHFALAPLLTGYTMCLVSFGLAYIYGCCSAGVGFMYQPGSVLNLCIGTGTQYWYRFQLQKRPFSEAGHFFFLIYKREQKKTAEWEEVEETEGLFLDQPLQLWIFYSGQGKKFFSSLLHIRSRTKTLQAQAGYGGEKWNSTDVTVLPVLLGSWWGMAPFFVLFEDQLSSAYTSFPHTSSPRCARPKSELIRNVWHCRERCRLKWWNDYYW